MERNVDINSSIYDFCHFLAYTLNRVEMGKTFSCIKHLSSKSAKQSASIKPEVVFHVRKNDLKMKIDFFFITNKNERTVEEETVTPCKHIFWIKS